MMGQMPPHMMPHQMMQPQMMQPQGQVIIIIPTTDGTDTTSYVAIPYDATPGTGIIIIPPTDGTDATPYDATLGTGNNYNSPHRWNRCHPI